MPELAVIMSVYKNDKLQFVREAVISILDQTFTVFDFYIVFDGPVSPDIDKYITSVGDSRIKLFRLNDNGGLAVALNFMLGKVLSDPNYKFIARMDADDISHPERFEKQFRFLCENPDIACVGCWYEEIDEEGKHLSYRKLPTEHEALRKRYYTRTPFAHPSVFYKRELIEKAGFYPTDTVLMEDNVLWGRALMEGLKFSNIPEYLFRFRIDKDFFKRRSGIKYGWNFIKAKFKIYRSLNSPLFAYILLIEIGIIKMMPSWLVPRIYESIREKQ
jgi:glycosyltransferase involved in cell wall biosynthesis